MALQELYPDLERIHEVILQKRDQVPQDPKSSTVRLLNTGWISQEPQVDEKGKLVKPFGIGDKLAEEGVEVGKAEEPVKIRSESSQAIYYIMVGLVRESFTNDNLYRSIDQVAGEQVSVVVAPDKLAEHAGAAVARVALAGVSGNRQLVLRRSAEALIGLKRFWEANGISPSEVGREI